MKKALLLLLLSMPLLCIAADAKKDCLQDSETRRKCCPGPQGLQGPRGQQGLQGPPGPLLIPFLTTSTDIFAMINVPTQFLSTMVTAAGTHNYLVLYNMTFLATGAGVIFVNLFVNGAQASDVNGSVIECDGWTDGVIVGARGNINLSVIASLSQGETVTVQVDPSITAPLDVAFQYLVLIQLD